MIKKLAIHMDFQVVNESIVGFPDNNLLQYLKSLMAIKQLTKCKRCIT
jgi:hypothetical protein